MDSNLNKNIGLGKEWDFWFNSAEYLIASTEKKKRDNYYFLFNCVDNELEYVSECVLDVLGYKREEFNMQKLFEIIHPDDLKYCNQSEFKTMQLCTHIFYNELFRYKISYSFRVKSATGIYITIKQQYKIVEIDQFGRIFKSFVQHQMVHDYEIRPDDDYEIFDEIKKRPVDFEKKYKLTKREIEILELINLGFQTKEISEKLCLSEHTVKTHRKNILSKTESSTILEVIKKTGI